METTPPTPNPPAGAADPAAAAALASGLPAKPRVIGRYTIQRELMRERHSVTFAAVDPVMNRHLIVKAVSLLPAGPRLNDAEHQRVEQAFMRQAQAAGRLHHPHIVTVFDAGLSHAYGYLVIEKINGRSLPELLQVGLKLAHVQAASIVARLSDAIEFAHRNGVSHGHLGPQHVYLLPNGTPKIAGFGGWIDDGAGGDEALADTPRRLPYFQNEVTEDTRRDDIRALGSLLYLLLTGQNAPRIDAAQATAHVSEADRGTMTRRAKPTLPLPLARLCDQAMLVGHVPDCPKTAAELRDALTAIVWNERHETVSPTGLGLPLAPPPQAAPVHMTTIVPEDNMLPPHLITDTPAFGRGPDSVPGTLNRPVARLLKPTTAPFATVDQSLAAPLPDNSVPMPPTAPMDLALSDAVPEAATWRDTVLSNPRALIGAVAFVVASVLFGVILAHVGADSSANAGGGADANAQADARAGVAPVSFDVRPWGEVFVDGRGVGVAPPMREIDLPSGVHRIEIRHGASSPWQADVEVRAPTPVHIEHRFKDDPSSAP